MKETNRIPLRLCASVALLRPDREGCMRCFPERPIITVETRRLQISNYFKFGIDNGLCSSEKETEWRISLT